MHLYYHPVCLHASLALAIMPDSNGFALRLRFSGVAMAQVRRLHKLNNPNSPLPFSRNELAEVIKNAATGALDVLQQSYATPNFCEHRHPPLLLIAHWPGWASAGPFLSYA